jgi:RNA polymerase sigma-70 factor (ECF subfamily)
MVAKKPDAAETPAPPDPRIAAAVSGDRVAAAELLGELLPRARNLIRYLVQGDAEVDDVAQEALIAVLRGLPSYRGEGTFKSWADRVVARTTFAALRRMRGERARKSAEPPELLAVPADGRADGYLQRRDLARLLDKLPDEQRHALVLHHAMGLSVPEIAEELGAPFETVRSRLRLGMTSLRALMSKGEK